MDAGLKEKLREIRHVALDMDGTIYLSDSIFPYTIPFLEQLSGMGIGFSFLTNNPTRSKSDYIAKLGRMGISCTEDMIVTTVEATIDCLKSTLPRARRLFILGTDSMVTQFVAAGYELAADDADDSPDAVVVSFDMGLSYSRLCRAAWWIKEGLPYVATNPDFVCPTDERTLLVDCGSICACLEAATGRRPDVVLGKPDPGILQGIIRRHGLQPSQLAMVGDRLYTDIATGLNAGALSVLVLSGEASAAEAAAAKRKPDLVVDHVGILGSMLREARD